MATLKRGMRGDEVRRLQNLLHLTPDGIYGPLTEEAVCDFQREHGLTVDGIAGPATMQAIGMHGGVPRRIDEIILHCTATPEGRDYTVGQIRNYHMQQMGMSDIGYHYLITLDGTVHAGRPLTRAGGHCKGHNTRSVGVAYVGGCAKDGKTPKDTRTPEQRQSLRRLVANLQGTYTGATVHCHYEFAAKACPSFQLCDL